MLDGGEGLVDARDHEVGVFHGEAHGRFDADDVAEEAAFAEEETEVAALVPDGGAFGGGGCFGFAVGDELDAEHESFAAHLSDELMFFSEAFELLDEVAADFSAIGL